MRSGIRRQVTNPAQGRPAGKMIALIPSLGGFYP
jgi:hypothetical protein